MTENVCAEVTSVVEGESDVTTGLAGEGDSNAFSIEMLEVRRRDEESIFAPRTAKLEKIIENKLKYRWIHNTVTEFEFWIPEIRTFLSGFQMSRWI